MFLKNIGLIEKNIRSFVDKDTVDCLQTIGVCNQSTVCLSANVLMFFSINLMFLKNIKIISKLPKGALPNTQGGVALRSRER